MLLRYALAVPLMIATCACGQGASQVTLRSTLLDGLHASHDRAGWFVPLNTAIAGLRPDQAKWTPANSAGTTNPDANHSVGMLTYHLWFWNSRALAKLRKENVPQAPGNNDETFNDFDADTWAQTVRNLDQIMKSLEDLVVHASDAEVATWAPTLRNIAEHNAYHTGQILYVRKLQGSWNPSNGVK